MASKLRGNRFFGGPDGGFVAPVESPFAGALGAHQPGLDEHPHMLADRRLADLELLGDQQSADAVLDQVAIDLLAEMGARVLEPFEDLDPLVAGQSAQQCDDIHFVSWQSVELMLAIGSEGVGPGNVKWEEVMAEYDIRTDVKYGPLERIDAAAIARAATPWFNQTLCRVNDSVVRLGVVEGEFHWHKHDAEDEFFLVLEGRLLIDIDGAEGTELAPGQGYVVPAGTIHRTRAPERTVILMAASTGVRPTGD